MLDSFFRKKGAVLILVAVPLGILLTGLAATAEALNDEEKRHEVETMYENYKKAFPDVSDISAEEALALKGQSMPVFVDVREPSEQTVSMLPGAITDEEFLKNPAAHGDRTVIGYCTISFRSGKLAEKLKKKGIQMFNLRGGILAWLHAGGKIYKDGKPTKQVHVYGKEWNLAPEGYETVW
jgi:sodium/bile acid cotransporter 7